MKVLKIILAALVFLSFQAQGKDNRGLAVTHSGSTGKRIALVIGNGNYKHTDILKKLSNPSHDAEDIAKALRGFGFEVIEKKDLSQEGMREAIAEFSRKITDSDAALFYYAGHGLQVKGKNYLVPVDAKIETEAQAGSRSIDVSEILEEMDNAKSKVNIVMLDACRSNDFSGKFRSGGARGLAAPSSQPKGTVIVYATDPGNVAADGDGRNGLFTTGLLTAFKGGDLSLHGVLVRASKEVERGSDKKQTPYINGPATLQEEFRFAPGTQVASLEPVLAPAQPATQSKSKEQIEDDTWRVAEGINTLDAYETYLSGYPNGRYAVQAKMKQAALKKPTAVQTQQQQAAAKLEQPNTEAGRQILPAKAELQRQQVAYGCVFPNSSDPAPGWVCDEPVEGYEITATGVASITSKNTKKKLPAFQQALLDATVQLAQQMKVQVQNMIKQYTETSGASNSVIERVNTSVTKQITSAKIGSYITLDNMVKQYLEETGKGKAEAVDRVNTSVSKLVMDIPCAYTMKSYVETTGSGASETVDETSDETGKQCTVKDVIKELSRAGLNVVDTVKSPGGDLFLLLGARKISELKIAY